jgi:hypothetical protein
MRLYIATKFENREVARRFMQDMEAEGHHITYDWTVGLQVDASQAIADLNAVITCDALVFLAAEEYNYQGALIEIGAALGLGKPVYVIGTASVTKTLFFKHPLVRHGVNIFTEEVLHGRQVRGRV